MVYSFTGDSDGGAIPSSVAIDGPTGVLYGVTGQGGTSNKGTVYSLTPPAGAGGAWTETVLYNFTGAPDDGSGPTGVTIGGGGVLYGTTGVGGAASAGTVFSLTPPASEGGAWTEQIIHNFMASGDGQLPSSGVVSGAGGVLYGATLTGGSAGLGTVFALKPPASSGSPWTEILIHSFTGSGSNDGASPSSPVGIGSNGVLFGTTRTGGIGNDFGTVFSLTPPAADGDPWTESILWSFTGGADGLDPTGGIAFGPHELVFGTTQDGGSASLGTAFFMQP
ncbi:MAG: choice-of-anchor tandem repeat GloVer-containing protein [Bryobacteraceae bacterium]